MVQTLLARCGVGRTGQRERRRLDHGGESESLPGPPVLGSLPSRGEYFTLVWWPVNPPHHRTSVEHGQADGLRHSIPLSSAARLSGLPLIRGFASHPHGWFALLDKEARRRLRKNVATYYRGEASG